MKDETTLPKKDGEDITQSNARRHDKLNMYLVHIALFMIFLIVTLPVYSADVLGASIKDAYATGNAGIRGFRAGDDATKIVVELQDVPEPFDASQLRLIGDSATAFTCTGSGGENVSAGGNYECVKEYPQQTITSSAQSAGEFSVRLYDQNNQPLTDIAQGTLLVDLLPPVISPVEPLFDLSDINNPKVNYKVTDKACSLPQCNGKCIGLSSVRFTVSGTEVGSVSDIGTGCGVEGTANLTALAVGGSVQTKQLCIEAVDNFKQGDTVCQEVTIDAKPPEITSVQLLSRTKPVQYTNGEAIKDLTLTINISEDSKLDDALSPGSGASRILVDASDLSEYPEHQSSYSKLSMECSSLGGTTYECKRPGMFLILTSPKTINIGIYAIDEYGNEVNTTGSISITYDDTPPVPTNIYSNWPGPEMSILREDSNWVFMDITESGSGMSPENVYIDFSAIGMQTLGANDCIAGWTCGWQNIEVTNKQSGSYIQLKPKYGTKDDAGNLMTEEVVGQFMVDKDAPYVPNDNSQYGAELAKHSNMTGYGEGHDPMGNITGGDALEIHLFVADHSGLLSATANFSDVVFEGSDDVPAVGCEPVDILNLTGIQVYDCVWQTPGVKEGYLENMHINFTFLDFANHTTTYTWDGIEILGREDPNATQTRWQIYMQEYRPAQGIDRMTWGLNSQRMFYSVTFLRTGRAQPLSIDFNPQTCFGLDWVGVDDLTGAYKIRRLGLAELALNNPSSYSKSSDSAQDIFYLYTNPGAIPEYYTMDAQGNNISVDSVGVNCSLTIQSIVTEGDQKFLSEPEIVNVSFPIPVYNNPLGQNIGNINDFIKEEEKYLDNGWNNFATILRTILEFAKQICSFIEIFMQLMQFISFMSDLIQGAKCAADAVPGGVAVGEGLGTTATLLGDTARTQSEFSSDIINELYFFCSLFLTCKVSKGTAADIDQSCVGKESETYCKIQKFWVKYNTWWGKVGTLSYESENMDLKVGAGEHDTAVFDSDSFDPSKSFISSILSGCLPGVVMNLEQIRQIKCQRLLCYKIDIPNGVPKWVCDKNYQYKMCTFVWGQVFAAIPILQWIQGISNLIEQIVANPLTFALGYAIDKVCTHIACRHEGCIKPPACNVCMIAQWGLTILTIGLDLAENTETRFESAMFDVCDEALKDNPSYENIDWPGTGKMKDVQGDAADATA